MKKSLYLKLSQQEANRKLQSLLVERYNYIRRKNWLLGCLYFPATYIAFSTVAIVSYMHRLVMLPKNFRFTPHYLRTVIRYENMTLVEVNAFLDFEFSEYRKKLSYGNIPFAKQKQIEATFDILYNEYKLPESDQKHVEIISNLSNLHQSVETSNKKISSIGHGVESISSQTNIISDDVNDIKLQTGSISEYTDRKLSEEKEMEERKIKKIQKETSKYNREKGRNLDTFESALSDKQIAILVKYCNEIPVFNVDITNKEMNKILYCAHSRPLQTTVNKYVALLFERLCDEKLICKTWKSVAMNQKCFISPNGKALSAKDLSSANATSGIIKPKIYDLVEECIQKIKEA